MRRPPSVRPLLPAAALAALAACTDRPSPAEPRQANLAKGRPPASDTVFPRLDGAGLLGSRAHWADGYVRAEYPTAAAYTPSSAYAFNRAGGAITITKPSGTTGRYVVTFRGLSALLGGKSTVHVTGYGSDATHCKPAGAYLAGDKVEVRCFRVGTGAPANATFYLLVTRPYSDLAFAYAHQATGTNYTPSSAGTWNPGGTTKVIRTGVGKYDVVFNDLGTQLPEGVGGHVQVNAVGTTNAHCKVEEWGATAHLYVTVGCYAVPTGAPVDRRFTVLFLQPAPHLAYLWANRPTVDAYAPWAVYSSNPAEGAISVSRLGVGRYRQRWHGADAQFFGYGHPQVTAWGPGGALCQVDPNLYSEVVTVLCFGPDGAPVDSRYTVLVGS